MKRVLRQYQLDCVRELKEIVRSGKYPLLIAPTGSGKTVIWTKFLNDETRRSGKKALVIVPRKSLVIQAIKELELWGLDVGAIAGNMKESRRCPIQVSTYQTLGLRDIWWFDPDYIVLDEAHLSAFPNSVRRLIPKQSTDTEWQGDREIFGEKKRCVIGVTATPKRADRSSLGEIFKPENMVFAPGIAALIRMGSLVRPTYGVCPNAVSGRMTFDPEYVRRVYELSDRRPTLIFVPGVARAKALIDTFARAGYEAALVVDRTPTKQREDIFDRFKAEELPIIINCAVLKEGIDLPVATNLILATDPQNVTTLDQCIGRVLRPATYKDGTKKTTATIYDLTGCVDRHGRPEERDYTAEDLELPDMTIGEVPMKECPSPSCDIKSLIGVTVCPCGCEFDINKRRVVVPEGDPYALLNHAERQHKAEYEQLLIAAFEAGEAPKTARIKFFETYGYTPSVMWRRNFAPTPEIAEWLRLEDAVLNKASTGWQLSLELVF